MTDFNEKLVLKMEELFKTGLILNSDVKKIIAVALLEKDKQFLEAIAEVRYADHNPDKGCLCKKCRVCIDLKNKIISS